MRRPVIVPIIIALAIIIGTGCASSKKIKQGLIYKDTHYSYQRILSNWTRSSSHYYGLDTEALATATYWSESFTEAYVAERTRAEALPEAKAAELRDQLLAGQVKANHFRLTFYTVERDWNDLGLADASWKVYLKQKDGTLIEPLSIRKHKIRPQAETVYFPQTDRWSRTYDVWFPKTDPDGNDLISEKEGGFGLTIAGVKTKIELVWSGN